MPDADADLAAARERMIKAHIAGRGIADPAVIAAMRAVPREAFVAPGYGELAYEDAPLPIGMGQTISQPYIVALMIEGAAIKPGDRVLDVGTGSGYAAAVMSLIAGRVHTVERFGELAEEARRRFERLGYGNIEVRTGDGSRGWPEAAPFDAILVAAGGPDIPAPLREQLAIGGRLVIPVGDARDQRLLRITRRDPTTFEEKDLGGVRFVPLVGAEGWEEAENGRLRPAAAAPSRRP